MSRKPFVLAHLSDVHLPHGTRMPLSALNLKRALGAANWLRNRRHVHVRAVLDAIVADLKAQNPGHIAVTGDLVNLGLPSEHEAALAWLRSLGDPGHVSVVPGNHDAYVAMHADPGHGRWRDYMRSDATEAAMRAGDAADATAAHVPAFPFVKRIGPIALIGLASGVPTPLLVSAGRLGSRQLDALAALLRATRQAGLVRIVAIHHPPHRYRSERRTGLADAAGLDQVLRELGADAVLHGHFHRAQTVWIDGAAGRVPIIGAASASAGVRHKGDMAGYNLLAISHGDEGRRRIELIRRGMTAPGGGIVELERTVLAS